MLKAYEQAVALTGISVMSFVIYFSFLCVFPLVFFLPSSAFSAPSQTGKFLGCQDSVCHQHKVLVALLSNRLLTGLSQFHARGSYPGPLSKTPFHFGLALHVPGSCLPQALRECRPVAAGASPSKQHNIGF